MKGFIRQILPHKELLLTLGQANYLEEENNFTRSCSLLKDAVIASVYLLVNLSIYLPSILVSILKLIVSPKSILSPFPPVCIISLLSLKIKNINVISGSQVLRLDWKNKYIP